MTTTEQYERHERSVVDDDTVVLSRDLDDETHQDTLSSGGNISRKVNPPRIRQEDLETMNVDESMEMDSADSHGSRNANNHHADLDRNDGAMMDESFHDALDEEEMVDAAEDDDDDDDVELDCYPYTFTPLLLFAQSDYFDKGHSNYNSVAAFFEPTTAPLGVKMLDNVLYDRKNMLYEDLIEYVIQNEMIVTCCIDAHFTALKVMNIGNKASGVYYDPLNSSLTRYNGDSLKTLLAFLLLKCNYGDSQHIQDNSDHYTGHLSSGLRKMIYRLWKKINLTPNAKYLGLQSTRASLNLDRYVLVNDSRNPKLMSVQLTGNTCYFQSYLYVLSVQGSQYVPLGDTLSHLKVVFVCHRLDLLSCARWGK